MRLNVGCGEHYAPGWTNTDLHDTHDRGPRPDVVCSILDLPFPDGCAEQIYLGHVLEHVGPVDLRQALREARRVLADAGRMLVVGPDVSLTALHEPILLDGVVNGGSRWPGDEHRWISTGDRTLCHVLGAGFDAYLTSIADVKAAWPIVDRAPWQFAITATKENHEHPDRTGAATR